MVISPLGYVRSDPHVPQSVRMRKPFMTAYPNSLAARGVRRLAETLIDERSPRPARPGFFTSLAARWALGRVAS
jgi:flagellar biosynthesis protein FlhG